MTLDDDQWHVYIIRLDNQGRKMLNGRTECFYTGITKRGVGVRFGDHLKRRGNSWVNNMCREAVRTPVYVELFSGSFGDVRRREKQIKALSPAAKRSLIASGMNALVGYKPLIHVVLRQVDGSETVEKIC